MTSISVPWVGSLFVVKSIALAMYFWRELAFSPWILSSPSADSPSPTLLFPHQGLELQPFYLRAPRTSTYGAGRNLERSAGLCAYKKTCNRGDMVSLFTHVKGLALNTDT